MAYVPPHLRGERSAAGQSPSTPAPATYYVSPEDIRHHFWPDTNVLAPCSQRTPYNPASYGSLYASAAYPSQLAYIVLFRDSNPRWKDDKIIFVKTRIDLLPGAPLSLEPDDDDDIEMIEAPDMSDGDMISETSSETPSHTPSARHPNNVDDTHSVQTDADADWEFVPGDSEPLTGPIAVFEQSRHTKRIRNFSFMGWYRVVGIAFLEPNSPELIRMLEQKWHREDRFGRVTQATRDAKHWKSSLSKRWAVVRLAQDQAAHADKGELRIERSKIPSDVAGRKTVNELLAELRANGT